MDYIFTVLWVLALASPSFVIQMVIWLKTKSKFVRYIMFTPSVVGFWIAFDGYFRITGLVKGSWPELGAFITAVYTGIYTLGVVLAIAVYKLIEYIKNKKR